jgi:glyoxylase-like metal-dependent hydrolase (beta-lactamase superfamily II)
MATNDRPGASNAEVHVLADGYARPDPNTPNRRRVGASVSFIRDGDARIIVDPGFQADIQDVVRKLGALGVQPSDVTDVVFSHHHPDHTLNAALFPNARFHDNWATYSEGDAWDSRPAEGLAISPSVLLIETPGHTPQDITTLAGTPDGIVAFTHLWGNAQQIEDALATDPAPLHANRVRVLAVANRIVPGHGAPFTPDENTPR